MNCYHPISRLLKSLSLFMALTFIAVNSQAQNPFNLDTLQAGQLMLNLTTNETTTVELDTLNVSMHFSAQGRDSTDLQAEVNRVIREARDILKDTDNIDYVIQQYNVYIIQDGRPNRNDPTWRAQQGIRMSSINSEALLVMTARLQKAGLVVSNMNFSLSSAKLEEVTRELMDTALRQLQSRADSAAATLGKSRADLVEVTLNEGQNFFGGRPMMAMEMRAMDAAMPVPVAEPGESQVSVSINARALLSP